MFGCWYDFCKIQWQIVIASSPILFPPLAFASMFTCYLRVTFHIFLNGQITCRLSGPSCPPLVQWHPYPLVPHDLSQPSSLPSGLTCYPSAQQLYPPAPHALYNPSIPNLQSFMPFFSHTSQLSGLSCPPSAQHPYPPVPHSLLQLCIP